jgi:hypothetical protein
MNHKVGELIDECIRLQNEIGLLSPIMLSHFSLKAFKDMANREHFAVKKSRYRARWEQISGLDKMRNLYSLQLRELHETFADLTKQIETSRLGIEEFKSLLSEHQFSWLISHQGEIRNYLHKIE